MMFLFAGLIGIVGAECFLRLPILQTTDAVGIVLAKAFKIIRSKRISDHWKERAILRYSFVIFSKTLILSCFLLLIVVSVSPICIVAFYYNKEFMSFIVRPFVLLYVTILTVFYIGVRKQKNLSPYGFFDRLLHSFALGNKAITEASFDIEQVIQKPQPALIIEGEHVFVAGLARAGTTLLMRRFYSSGMFRSLTYRDMPFVLMPNLWEKLSSFSSKHSKKQERAHADGLLVNYDSPEAFEEVFWRIHSEQEYIQETRLIPMIEDEILIEKYQKYIASILMHTSKTSNIRYLSKNNNNILRLSTIQKAFPLALIIIPYRDPLQQADSLLSIHKRFVEAYKNDKFVRKYMRWLGHYEFGIDHKRFCFTDDPIRYTNTYDINYWLELWLKTYQWLHEVAPQKALFLSYEAFCADPDTIWNTLTAQINIPSIVHDADAVVFRKRDIAFVDKVDTTLLSKANKVYATLNNRSL